MDINTINTELLTVCKEAKKQIYEAINGRENCLSITWMHLRDAIDTAETNTIKIRCIDSQCISCIDCGDGTHTCNQNGKDIHNVTNCPDVPKENNTECKWGYTDDKLCFACGSRCDGNCTKDWSK